MPRVGSWTAPWPNEPSHTLTLVLGIGAGAALGGAVVGTIITKGTQSQVEEMNLECSPPRVQPLCRRGERESLITNVLWASFGIFAAGAIISYLFESSTPNDYETSRTLSLGVSPTDGGAAASFAIRF